VSDDERGADAGRQRPGALITGASRGIGRAIAERLAAMGYDLTLTGRRRDTLQDVARDLAGTDARIEIAAADMAVEEEVRGLARDAGRLGSLDLLVLCAGVGTSGPVADYPMQRFDRQVAVNLRAPFLLIRECLPLLRTSAAAHPARGARIVAVASVAGVLPEPGLAAYGATKAALISLCRSVNAEESRHGVSATAISPGYVDTEMTAWVRDRVDPAEMIKPSDIAGLVAAIASLSAQAIVPHVMVTRPGTGRLSA